jgi:endonuclease G
MMKILRVLFFLLLGTVSGSASPLDCIPHFLFGMPVLTGAANTTTVCHTGYATSHDNDLLVPRWVAYRLTGENTFGCLKRTNDFHPDENLPPNRRATPADYSRSGYDQGHQAPAQDFAWRADVMHDSFSMANMAPQLPGLNRQGWERLEETVRAWAADRGTVNVYVGPVVSNATKRIGRNRVAVPTAFWKVVVDPVRGDVLAFVMPQKSIPKGNLSKWQTSVSAVEEGAQIKLPLSIFSTVRTAKPPLWPADLAAWNSKHKAACAH